LLRHLGDQRLIVVGRGQIEQLREIGGVLRELVEAFDGAFVARALAQQLLRPILVFPEAGRLRVVIQAFDAMSQAVDVKDTSPAPRGAGPGRREPRAVR